MSDPGTTTPGGSTEGLPLGRILLGALLVLVGIGWLVDSLGLATVPWQGLAPAALVVVGLSLLVTARRGPSGGLVAAGVVLSVVVLASSLFSFPLGGRLNAVGDHQHRPTSVRAAEEGFALAVGELTLDLRDLPMDDWTYDGRVTIEAGVGIGQLVVIVPSDVAVDVRGRAGIGEVVVGNRASGGVGVELHELLGNDETDVAVSLEVSVGIGKVKVRT